jgi:hypothetical protein
LKKWEPLEKLDYQTNTKYIFIFIDFISQ